MSVKIESILERVYGKSLFLHVIPVGAIIRFFVSVWSSCDGTI